MEVQVIANPFAEVDAYKSRIRGMNGIPAKGRDEEELKKLTASKTDTPNQNKDSDDDDSSEPEDDLNNDSSDATHEDTDSTTDPDIDNNKSTTGDVDWKKRRDDLKRHYDEKVEDWKKKEKELTDKLQALEEQAAKATAPQIPSNDEELASFQKKYPSTYNNIISLIRKELIEQDSKLSGDLKSIQAKQKEYDESVKITKIKEKHPDVRDVKNSTEFKTWLESQSSGVKALFNSDVPEDIIEGFDLFKLKTKSKSKKQQEKVEAASDVSINNKSSDSNKSGAKNKKIWLESEIEALSFQAYLAFEKDIDLAKREGRVLIGK